MRILLAAALAAPTTLFAAGGNDSPPPKPVVTCTGAQVFDKNKGKCVDPQKSALNRDEIYLAVRQLAYAGRYEDAQALAAFLPEDDSGRLTYMGFTHRKLGDFEVAMRYYQEAIDRDPDNILARSYMGQGFVEAGAPAKALVQLHQIRAYGGSGTWSETSLQNAIESGVTYSY
ncbi:MAG: tetratricopeptide repeat protein [Pseudomonadota bacterium]